MRLGTATPLLCILLVSACTAGDGNQDRSPVPSPPAGSSAPNLTSSEAIEAAILSSMHITRGIEPQDTIAYFTTFGDALRMKGLKSALVSPFRESDTTPAWLVDITGRFYPPS